MIFLYFKHKNLSKERFEMDVIKYRNFLIRYVGDHHKRVNYIVTSADEDNCHCALTYTVDEAIEIIDEFKRGENTSPQSNT